MEAGPIRAVLDVNGIGYEVHIPVTTAGRLPGVGEQVRLLTHPVYREDSATLYGFDQEADRQAFQLLVEKVSGVGPRLALAILSRMDASALRQVIGAGDIKSLCGCPGIGKKTAERLIIELRDKFANTPGKNNALPDFQGSGGTSTIASDAIAALIALGYKQADAEKAIDSASSKLADPEATTEMLVRAALR